MKKTTLFILTFAAIALGFLLLYLVFNKNDDGWEPSDDLDLPTTNNFTFIFFGKFFSKYNEAEG